MSKWLKRIAAQVHDLLCQKGAMLRFQQMIGEWLERQDWLKTDCRERLGGLLHYYHRAA